jgi:putative transposase
MRIVTLMTRQGQLSAGGVHTPGYQMVGCPKYRRPVLAGRVAGRCKEPIRAQASGHGWPMMALQFMPDHVHLSVKAHRSDSPFRVGSPFKGFTWWRLAGRVTHLRSRLPAGWSRPCFVAAGVASRQTVRWYMGLHNERQWREERAR